MISRVAKQNEFDSMVKEHMEFLEIDYEAAAKDVKIQMEIQKYNTSFLILNRVNKLNFEEKITNLNNLFKSHEIPVDFSIIDKIFDSANDEKKPLDQKELQFKNCQYYFEKINKKVIKEFMDCMDTIKLFCNKYLNYRVYGIDLKVHHLMILGLTVREIQLDCLTGLRCICRSNSDFMTHQIAKYLLKVINAECARDDVELYNSLGFVDDELNVSANTYQEFVDNKRRFDVKVFNYLPMAHGGIYTAYFIEACECVVNFCDNNETNRMIFKELNVLSIIVAFFDTINTQCFKRLSTTKGDLEIESKSSENVLENEYQFYNFKKLHPNDKQLCIVALCRLGFIFLVDDDIRTNFGSAHDNAKFLSNHLNLQCILNIFKKYSDHGDILTGVIRLLSKICVRSDICKKVSNVVEPESILFISQKNLENEKCLNSLLNLIKVLCGNDELKDEYMSLNLSKLIRDAMEMHSHNAHILTYITALIAMVSLRNSKYVNELIAYNIDKLCLNAITQHSNEKLYVNACYSLRNIVSRNKEYIARIQAFDAESILSPLLNNPSKDITDAASAALRDLNLNYKKI